MGLFDIFKKKKKAEPEDVQKVVETKTVVPEKKEDAKTEHHNVTGTQYYEKDILSFSKENPDYKLKKAELIKAGLIDRKICKLVFSFNSVELVPEPENEIDSNAVKVMIDGLKVGYIKKGSCTHIKNLMKDNKIEKIEARIRGGAYKEVYKDDMGDAGIEYEYETGTDKLKIDLNIKLK